MTNFISLRYVKNKNKRRMSNVSILFLNVLKITIYLGDAMLYISNGMEIKLRDEENETLRKLKLWQVKMLCSS